MKGEVMSKGPQIVIKFRWSKDESQTLKHVVEMYVWRDQDGYFHKILEHTRVCESFEEVLNVLPELHDKYFKEVD